MFEMHNLPPIRAEYFKHPENANAVSDSDVKSIIEGTRLEAKIELRLDYRKIYRESGLKPKVFADSVFAAPSKNG